MTKQAGGRKAAAHSWDQFSQSEWQQELEKPLASSDCGQRIFGNAEVSLHTMLLWKDSQRCPEIDASRERPARWVGKTSSKRRPRSLM